MIVRTRLRLLVGVLAVLLLTAACGADGEQATEDPGDADETAQDAGEDADEAQEDDTGDSDPVDPESVTVAFSIANPDANTAFLWIPEALGYYEEEGLDVEIVNLGGSVEMSRAVATGQAEFGIGTLEAVPQFNDQGDPLQAIYQYAYQPIFYMGIPSGSEISDPSELEGRTVGVVAAGSAAIPVLQYLVEESGVPYSSIDVVPIGLGPQAVAAIEGGEVDAVMFWDTAYVDFEDAGVEFEYFSTEELDQGYASMGIIYDRSRAEELADVSERFLRAITKGLVFSEEDPQAAIQAMGEVEPVVLEDAELSVAKLEARLVRHELPGEANGQYGWSNEENWDRLQQVLVDGGVIDAEQDFADVWNGEFLDAANDFDQEEVREDVGQY